MICACPGCGLLHLPVCGMADAYAQGFSEGFADGLVAGAEGERERAERASWAGRSLAPLRCNNCEHYQPEHGRWGICGRQGDVRNRWDTCKHWRAAGSDRR